MIRAATITLMSILAGSGLNRTDAPTLGLQLTPQDVLQTHGLSVLLFHNAYHGFSATKK
jgi:hypothetical protein